MVLFGDFEARHSLGKSKSNKQGNRIDGFSGAIYIQAWEENFNQDSYFQLPGEWFYLEFVPRSVLGCRVGTESADSGCG